LENITPGAELAQEVAINPAMHKELLGDGLRNGA